MALFNVCKIIKDDNPQLSEDLKMLLSWYWDDYYKPGKGGRAPDRELAIIGCAYYKFNEKRKSDAEATDFTITYDDILAYRDNIENSFNWNKAAAGQNYDEKKRIIKKVLPKLKRYYKEEENGKNAVYILNDIIPAKKGSDINISFHIIPINFSKKTYQDIPIEVIKEAIIKYNVNHPDLKQWENGYITQDALISKEEHLSPEELINARKADIFFKRGLLSNVNSAEKEILSKIDPLNMMKIINNPDNDKLIIIGEPGIGKTTTLQYIAYEYSTNSKPEIPIYVNLKGYIFKSALWEYIRKLVPQSMLSWGKDIICEKALDTILESAGFIFLFDGYNESSEKDAIDYEIELLTKSQSLKGNRFIITSRKYSYPENLEGFNTCELSELSDVQRIELMKHFGINRPDNLLDEIRKKNIDAFSRAPFYLKEICQYFKEKNSLKRFPKSRFKLMQKIIERSFMKDRRNLRFAKKLKIKKEHILNDIMPFIAFQTLNKYGVNCFHSTRDLPEFIKSEELTDIREYYGKNFDEPDDILNLITQYGLIDIYGENCSFRHQLFQDFFASIELKKRIINGSLALGEKRTNNDFLDRIIKHIKFDSAVLFLIWNLSYDVNRKLIDNIIYNYDPVLGHELILELRGERESYFTNPFNKKIPNYFFSRDIPWPY